MIAQRVVSVDGAPIAVWGRGIGSPLVIFLAGGLCDHRSWLPQLQSLNAQWRLVAVDPRGCGRSTVDGPYDISQQARDVAAVIATETNAPAIVVSHSMGGYAALLLNHYRPELVAALVFIDVPLAEGGANTTRIVRTLAEAESLSPLSGMVESMGLLADQTMKETIRDMMLTRPVNIAIGMLSGLEAATSDLGALLGEAAHKPCLAIWPGPRPLGGDPAWLARHYPAIQQAFVPQSGHFVQLEQPEQVNLLLEQFVAGLSNTLTV